MPNKNNGMKFEVHPSPVKGKDGKNIVYVRPAGRAKMSMDNLEEYCIKNYNSRYGELTMAFSYFMRAAGELMAKGYRIDTPIGSFAPRLKLIREITDPDEVTEGDVVFDGVDYKPGKRWNEELLKWSEGFRSVDNPNTQEILADKPKLEELLQKLLDIKGYTTVTQFKAATNLTDYSARKQLNEWCEGDKPKLLKSLPEKKSKRGGHQYIYTAI